VTFFPWQIHPLQRPAHGGSTHRQTASEFGQGSIGVLEDELFQASGREQRLRTVSALQRLAVTGVAPAPENPLYPTEADTELIGQLLLGVTVGFPGFDQLTAQIVGAPQATSAACLQPTRTLH
jgi:hypothetical protein